jgi:hypothetical protein
MHSFYIATDTVLNVWMNIIYRIGEDMVFTLAMQYRASTSRKKIMEKEYMIFTSRIYEQFRSGHTNSWFRHTHIKSSIHRISFIIVHGSRNYHSLHGAESFLRRWQSLS